MQPQFDPLTSMAIDAIIVQLDRNPTAPLRWLLRLQKRRLERGIRSSDGYGYLLLAELLISMAELLTRPARSLVDTANYALSWTSEHTHNQRRRELLDRSWRLRGVR